MSEALDFIARHPDMFFARGMPDRFSLVEDVLIDLGRCRPEFAKLEVLADAVFVSSDVDWLEVDGLTPEALFGRIVARGEGFQNQHRSEVMIAAASQMVLSDGPAGRFSFGSPSQPDLLRIEGLSDVRCVRFIYWRMKPPEPDQA